MTRRRMTPVLFHVQHLALVALLGGCSGNAFCGDAEVGEWAFKDGQWLHCSSWVAACTEARADGEDACEAEARSFGCKP